MNAQHIFSTLIPFRFPSPLRLFERIWYHLGRLIVSLARRVFYRTDILFQVPLPAGAKILAPNHPSTVDPFLLTTLVPEQVSMLIIDTLFKIPVVGASLRMSGQICVECGKGTKALEQGIRYLKEGRTVGIFPEGVISPETGGLARARTGAVRMATATGVPIYPIGIALERDRLHYTRTMIDGKPEVGTWYFNGAYAVTVGEPLFFNGDPEDRNYVQMATEALAGRIEALAAQSARRLAELRLAERPTVLELLYRWIPFFSTDAL